MAPRGTSRRIAEELRGQIRDGGLQPGMMLPSESQLAQQHGVARGTVRSALVELADEGLIEVVPGLGRRVVGRTEPPLMTAYAQIASDLAARVRNGEFAVDLPMPSEADLMAQYGVSRNTVRRACRVLGDAGLVEVRHGAGAFVRR